MTDEEKRAAVLIALAKEGVTDLDSLADLLVKKLSPDWRPDERGKELLGTWFALRTDE